MYSLDARPERGVVETTGQLERRQRLHEEQRRGRAELVVEREDDVLLQTYNVLAAVRFAAEAQVVRCVQ